MTSCWLFMKVGDLNSVPFITSNSYKTHPSHTTPQNRVKQILNHVIALMVHVRTRNIATKTEVKL